MKKVLMPMAILLGGGIAGQGEGLRVGAGIGDPFGDGESSLNRSTRQI